MNQGDYNDLFEANKKDSIILKEAFKQVSDIRKFEIELYWKRATYFWALIAVAFAGYFSILSSEHMPSKLFLSLVVSCIGFVFTFAWFLSSRGSKYWQENWENHLDLLEEKITGPLYKTLLERPKHENLIDSFITGPLSISVSKINQWVSVFIIFSWGVLMLFSFLNCIFTISTNLQQTLKLVALILTLIITLISCLLMFRFGKTHKDEHNPIVVKRNTRIK